MSEIHAITMPKWGMEMAEGDINAWHFSEGSSVQPGDEVVDIETSKIVNTLSAHSGGVLRRILAQPGETLPVGALLAVLADTSVADADVDAFIACFANGANGADGEVSSPAIAQTKSPATAVREMAEGTVAAPLRGLSTMTEDKDDSDVHATPIARRLAHRYGLNLHNVEATGRHQRVTKADLERAVLAAGGELIAPPSSRADKSSTANRDDSNVHATPVARRLARELGINLHDCRISGERGRVCKADVEAVAALQQPAARAGAKLRTPAVEELLFEEIPLAGMRKTIAARLQQSKQSAPHFRVHIDAEIDALLAVRQQINANNPNAKISVNDFIVKACACALVKVPELNVQFDGSTVRRFVDADISVAVALDDGLITPIVKAANRKGLIAISNELRDLVTRAKIGKLKPEEFQGGTFSVSNLGMFGIREFDAIINPPQGAILAIGAGEQRPVVRNGELTVATVVSLSLSSDHRIIDGALAARFMAVLRQFLEQPATMLG